MQGFCAMYRCLWDKKFDKTAIYVYETPHLYAIATVHGLYFDWRPAKRETNNAPRTPKSFRAVCVSMPINLLCKMIIIIESERRGRFEVLNLTGLCITSLAISINNESDTKIVVLFSAPFVFGLEENFEHRLVTSDRQSGGGETTQTTSLLINLNLDNSCVMLLVNGENRIFVYLFSNVCEPIHAWHWTDTLLLLYVTYADRIEIHINFIVYDARRKTHSDTNTRTTNIRCWPYLHTSTANIRILYNRSTLKLITPHAACIVSLHSA